MLYSLSLYPSESRQICDVTTTFNHYTEWFQSNPHRNNMYSWNADISHSRHIVFSCGVYYITSSTIQIHCRHSKFICLLSNDRLKQKRIRMNYSLVNLLIHLILIWNNFITKIWKKRIQKCNSICNTSFNVFNVKSEHNKLKNQTE